LKPPKYFCFFPIFQHVPTLQPILTLIHSISQCFQHVQIGLQRSL
jgi:hypothetical protein